MIKQLNILGTRGVPAAHGGFETFAQQFALWLVARGWKVVVYCQHDEDEPNAPADLSEDTWEGVDRVHVRARGKGPLATMNFDLRCVKDVLRRPGIDLVLGYNTAVFCLAQRLRGRKLLINMDGIEWKRNKWNAVAKGWFWINEIIGAHLAHIPIADHPEIKRHLQRHGTRGIEVIPYGSPKILSAPVEPLAEHGLEAGQYLISIARIEPENSLLELVEGFSTRRRGKKLVVLGNLFDDNSYHRELRNRASDEVVFPGAIYERNKVAALRFHALAYLHGHRVGGTNPSLVEALGAGNPVLAHDNPFNRWVAGEGQFYFSDAASLEKAFEKILTDTRSVEEASRQARLRHEEEFTLDKIHNAYLDQLERLTAEILHPVFA